MKTLILCCFLCMKVIGANWYDQKLEGWYYFEDPASKAQYDEPLTPKQAEVGIESEKQLLKQLLSLALLKPTFDNVRNYMERQKLWLDQSGKFASTWGKLLLENPQLGDFLETPTTSYGAELKKKIDLQNKKELLSSLSEDHFLVFFYKGDDPYAVAAGEVARLFGEANGWTVKTVSLDGKLLFSDSEVDKGISHSFGVNANNAFFVADPFARRFVPVGAGLLSVTQLEENISTQFTAGVSDE